MHAWKRWRRRLKSASRGEQCNSGGLTLEMLAQFVKLEQLCKPAGWNKGQEDRRRGGKNSAVNKINVFSAQVKGSETATQNVFNGAQHQCNIRTLDCRRAGSHSCGKKFLDTPCIFDTLLYCAKNQSHISKPSLFLVFLFCLINNKPIIIS